MDKVVDHLLVFRGEGEIKDFPGNYTQYREWQKLEDKKSAELKEAAQKATASRNGNNAPTPSPTGKSQRDPNAAPQKRKMTFKEKQEFAQLEKDIEALTAEKESIETALSSGSVSVEQITEMSKRLPILNEELDEKEMRWLELSEI